MATATLEERVAALERKIEDLTVITKSKKRQKRGWEAIYGTFANCPAFDEAVRLGREYRESLRPPDYDDSGE